MTMSNVNSKQPSSVSNNNFYSASASKSTADEKLAAAAFQKMYELLLEKNMNSSAYDISECSDSVQSSYAVGSDDSSDIWNQLILTQQMAMITGSDEGYPNTAFDYGNSTNTAAIYNSMNLSGDSYNNIDYQNLGVLSAKFESSGNPGVISNNPGDPGGKSYGAWQFSSRMGSLQSFLGWLKEADSKYYNALSNSKQTDGGFGSNFDNTWAKIASVDKSGFLKLQQDYVKEKYYDRAADKLNSKFGFDVNTKSQALKNVLWSTVVQHGVSGAVNIFSKINLSSSDSQIISGVYNERQKVDLYFSNCSSSIKRSVFNRFSREKSEALAMLESEQ